MAARLSADGFQIEPAQTNGGLVLLHLGEVSDPAFDRITAGLRDAFEADGWMYDGWECGRPIDEGNAA